MTDPQIKWQALTRAEETIVIDKQSGATIAAFPGMMNRVIMSVQGILVGGGGAGYVYILSLQ